MLVTASSNQTSLYRLTGRSLAATGEPASVEAIAQTAKSGSAQSGQYSPEQLNQIAELKARDQEVRAHEQAHLSAAGGIAVSGARFTFVTGPDGQRYATGGEVNIDVSEVAGNPEATLRKAETIRRAALAPASPSGPDQSIAAKAAAMANKARGELLNSQKQPSRNGELIDLTA
jgi:hypothetical protein